MTVEYTNRKGDTYYLQAGVTRTGKPRYWFGRKLTGESVATVPEGHEIFEHPEKGLVTLRKTKPTEISALERDLVSEGIRRYAGLEHFIVDVENNSIVVYLSDMDDADVDAMVDMFGGPWMSADRIQKATARMIGRSHYTKMFRFILEDTDNRVFTAQRWCFRGSVDDWIPIGRPGPLEFLMREYGQHLGKESFYELM